MPRERKKCTKEELEKLVGSGAKKYVRYEEGAKLFSVGRNTFIEMAKDAKAVFKYKGVALVDIQKVNSFIEDYLGEE